MIGPRNSVIRKLMGDDVSDEDLVTDQSEWIDSRFLRHWTDVPELWIDLVHDHVGEEME